MSLIFFALLALLYFPAQVMATEKVSVLALEYPPYTSQQSESLGISFVALRKKLAPLGVEPEAIFLPPARAGMHMESREWCFSFYPPNIKSDNYQFIQLDTKPIALSFYRWRQPEAFDWQALNELAGLRVAMLRSFNRGGLYKVMLEAGLEVIDVNSLSQGFSFLDKRRVDLVFADEYGGAYIMAQLGMDVEKVQFAQTPLTETFLHVWGNLNCVAAKRLAISG